MLKDYKLAILLLVSTFLTGCEEIKNLVSGSDEDNTQQSLAIVDFGEVEHYQPFLWKQGNDPILETTLVTEFNQASTQANSYITLEFQDEHGAPVKNQNIIISINDNEIQDGSYTLNASAEKQELNVTLKFVDNNEANSFRGFLVTKQSNLDRVNDTPLENDTNANILQWEAAYEPVINPLKMWLLIVLSIFALLLILRLTVFKKKLYPTFKGTVRYFESPTQSRSINFNGNRQVVITNRPHKQSAFDKLWRGKILYITDPLFTAPVEFTPRKRGTIKYRLDTNKYAVSPSDIFFQRGIEYKIKSTESKQTVILK